MCERGGGVGALGVVCANFCFTKIFTKKNKKDKKTLHKYKLHKVHSKKNERHKQYSIN